MKQSQKVQGILFSTDPKNIEFLLLKRSDAEGGYWQPLTGTVEPYEAEYDCLLRELSEEVGLEVNQVRITDVIDTFTWSREETIYTETVRGIEIPYDAPITLSEEHEKYRWCNLEDALSLLKHESNKQSLQTLFDSLQ